MNLQEFIAPRAEYLAAREDYLQAERVVVRLADTVLRGEIVQRLETIEERQKLLSRPIVPKLGSEPIVVGKPANNEPLPLVAKTALDKLRAARDRLIRAHRALPAAARRNLPPLPSDPRPSGRS